MSARRSSLVPTISSLRFDIVLQGDGQTTFFVGVTPFSAIFVPPELRDAVSERAWLQAMLDAERALATAGAGVGLVPEDAAARIAEACRAELYDAGRIADAGREVGNPAEPLVRELRGAVGGGDADYVHLGATSQDIVDTAAMLVTRRALDLVLVQLDRLAAECAALASTHRSTPMAARTLLQQAVPTTFGLKAAGWLIGAVDARRALAVSTGASGSRRSSVEPQARSRRWATERSRSSASTPRSSRWPTLRSHGTRTVGASRRSGRR